MTISGIDSQPKPITKPPVIQPSKTGDTSGNGSVNSKRTTPPVPAKKTEPSQSTSMSKSSSPPSSQLSALPSKEASTQSRNNFLATSALSKTNIKSQGTAGNAGDPPTPLPPVPKSTEKQATGPGESKPITPITAAPSLKDTAAKASSKTPTPPTGPQDGKDVKFKDGKIVIFDGFTGSENFIDFNGDTIGDISHGDVVKKVLTAQGVPDDKIAIVDKGTNNGNDVGVKFYDFAKKIEANDGKLTEPDPKAKPADKKTVQTPVSAVNFSQSTFTPIAEVAETLKLKDLTAANLLERRDEVRNALADFAAKNPDHDYAKNWKGIQGIDTLNKLGIPVYVAGGNGGPGDVNLFGLGNGAVNVGATQPIDSKVVTTNVVNLISSGFGLGTNVLPIASNAAILNDSLTPKPWADNDTTGTAINTLIKRTAQGVLPVTEIKDKKDQVQGFNFTGGTRIDAPLSAVYDPLLHDRLYEKFGEPKGYRPPVDTAFRGTSFAAPNALGADWTKFFNLAPKK